MNYGLFLKLFLLKDITVFEIDGRLMKQECCFIRVITKQGIGVQKLCR